jgi:hypothetical protein
MVWVTLAFVFFRSASLSAAGRMFAGLSGFHGAAGWGALTRDKLALTRVSEIALPVVGGSLLAFLGPISNKIADDFQPSARLACAVCGMLLIAALVMNSTASSEFLYVAF